jgi:hypothetical protein
MEIITHKIHQTHKTINNAEMLNRRRSTIFSLKNNINKNKIIQIYRSQFEFINTCSIWNSTLVCMTCSQNEKCYILKMWQYNVWVSATVSPRLQRNCFHQLSLSLCLSLSQVQARWVNSTTTIPFLGFWLNRVRSLPPVIFHCRNHHVIL